MKYDVYYVEIWQLFPEKTRVKVMGPFSERKARKVSDEIDINIDDEFFQSYVVRAKDA